MNDALIRYVLRETAYCVGCQHRQIFVRVGMSDDRSPGVRSIAAELSDYGRKKGWQCEVCLCVFTDGARISGWEAPKVREHRE